LKQTSSRRRSSMTASGTKIIRGFQTVAATAA
jgi:hypothetical protein